MLKIAIGSDHRGYTHKSVIQQSVSLDMQPIEWLDVGAFNDQRSDYPPFAYDVVTAMKKGDANFGVLLCGSGAGMAIAANRFDKIYAALVWNVITAQRAKEEDNANILVLAADYCTPKEAVEMVIVWLNAQFLDNRYEKRIEMIDKWSGLK